MPWLLIQIVLMNKIVDFALSCSYSATTVTTDFGGGKSWGFGVGFFLALILEFRYIS